MAEESAGFAGTSGDLAKDFWGGLAAMLVAIPSALAYGVASFAALGPEYAAHGATSGLVGAVALGIVASAATGAPRLITAPCAPAAAVMGTLAGELAAGRAGGDPARVILLLGLVSILSGLLQVIYGAVRGGTLIKYIPYPVVSGYLSGVGLIILSKQLPAVLGLPKEVHLGEGLLNPGLWKGTALFVGVSTAAAMVAAPKLTKAVPAAIIGLAGGLAAYFGMAAFRPELLQLAGNKFVIGPLGGGVQSAWHGMSSLWSSASGLGASDVLAMATPALTLSVLLSMDTLKTCVVVDALTRSRHDSNRTLLSQGFANLASAVLGGVPGAGTMGATLVNVTSGGQTRLAGAFEGAFVLLSFLLLGGLIGWVPVAALAGILVVVGFRMVDPGTLHLLRQRSTVLDFVVILAVVATALVVGLIEAAGVGILLSALLFMREQIKATVIRRKSYGDELFSKQHRLPDERAALEQYGTATVVCQLQGSLFFGTTDQLYTELEADLKKCRFVVLDMQRVAGVDYTAAHMLEQIESVLGDHGGQLLFSGLPARIPTGQDLQTYFDQVGLVRPTRHIRLFETLDDALEWSEDRILEEHGFHQEATEKPLDLAEIELTREFDAEALAALRGLAVEKSFDPGQTIFKRKDEGDEVYLIRRGMVRIILPLKSGKHHHIATFARGNFFGDIAFLSAQKRTADAVATAPTDLYLLSRKRFDEFSRKNPEMGVRVYARLAKALALRLRDTDRELRKLQDS